MTYFVWKHFSELIFGLQYFTAGTSHVCSVKGSLAFSPVLVHNRLVHIDRLATANGVRWYGHVLRRDDDSVLRVALNLEVTGKRKRGRPKKTWKKQVEEETEKVGLKKEDALRRDKWRDGVREIAEGMG